MTALPTKKPMFLFRAFREWPIAAKLNAALCLALVVLFVVAIASLTLWLGRVLEEKTLTSIRQANQQAMDMLSAYNTSMEKNAEKLGNALAAGYPSGFSLDESTSVEVGGAATPQLKSGSVVLNRNFEAVDAFTATTQAVTTIFARKGDDFVRVATSLKKENGDRAVGTLLGSNHPAYARLLKGEPFTGKARLFGRDYMTRYLPQRDKSGRIVAVLFIGLDFTTELAALKERIRSVKFGRSGYIFAIDAGTDKGHLVIHPAQEGTNLLEAKDADGVAFIRDIVERKEGSLTYQFANPSRGETEPRQKIAVFAHFTPWNWVIVSSSYKDELAEDAAALRNRLIVAAVGLMAVLLLVVILSTYYWVSRPLAHAVEIAGSVADGRLDNAIEVTVGGEAGALLTTLKDMQAQLNNILREVEDCGRNMGQSAFQVAAISNEIAEVSKQQENRSGEVSSAMQQLHQVSSDVQGHADEAAAHSRQVETLAQEGIENVQRNIVSMAQTSEHVSRASTEIAELEQSAQKIHHIVNTIKDIAGQTNLLALNAAIEAARAGEQGRGFAVVADEVRKLADRTTHSATEVSEIIGQISGKVQQVATTMQVAVQQVSVTQAEAGNTAQTIERMASNALETVLANQGISEASHLQLEQFALLESTLATLFLILKSSGEKVQTTATIGDDLRTVTGRLNSIMSGFKFNSGLLIEAAQQEKRRTPRAQNSLRVKVSQNGTILDAVTSDFSLTGMCLRLPQPAGDHERLDLSLFLPHDNLSQYEKQEPLRMTGRVSWQRQDGRNYLCGIEFVEVGAANRERIRQCFSYFRKNAEF